MNIRPVRVSCRLENDTCSPIENAIEVANRGNEADKKMKGSDSLRRRADRIVRGADK